MHSQPQNDVENKRVVLGLSGGVDSAVAAILLQQGGAEVHALHMTNWEDDDGYLFVADNFLDKRYRVHGSGIDATGRNFLLSVRTTW